MGYRPAILPGMLTKTIQGAVDAAPASLEETHRHPTPPFDATVHDAFRIRFLEAAVEAAE